MARIQDRHPAGAPGPWFVDDGWSHDLDADAFHRHLVELVGRMPEQR